MTDSIRGGIGNFTNPYYSWQIGLNELPSGLIRQNLPASIEYGEVTEDKIRVGQGKLRKKPRKRIGRHTPNEILSVQAAMVKLQGCSRLLRGVSPVIPNN